MADQSISQDVISISHYTAILLAGGVTIIGALAGSFVAHRLSLSRDRRKDISKINKALLNDMASIEIELNTVRTFSSPLEAIGYMRRFELSSVNFTAFKKTCTMRQQKELTAAYNDYKTTDDKYQSLGHLKTLVEKIINER